jgi:uncharacterized protein (DUF58 family)
MAEALAHVHRLEIRTRGLVESLFSGEYTSVFQGRGLDFAQVRQYQPGDDVRAIDWKVTARRGEPYVRQFVEERDLVVALVVDVSASGRLGPGEKSGAEAAAEIAAALTFAATRNNDRTTLLLVSDRVEHVEPVGSGRRHAVRSLAALVSHSTAGRRTDLAVGLDRISRTLKARATVFLISDFIEDFGSPRFRDSLTRAPRLHDVVAVRLGSRAMAELPDVGWIEMTDAESGRRVTVDTGSPAVRERFRRGVTRARAEVSALFAELGIESIEVDTDADPLAPVAEYFRRRRRVTR